MDLRTLCAGIKVGGALPSSLATHLPRLYVSSEDRSVGVITAEMVIDPKSLYPTENAPYPKPLFFLRIDHQAFQIAPSQVVLTLRDGLRIPLEAPGIDPIEFEITRVAGAQTFLLGGRKAFWKGKELSGNEADSLLTSVSLFLLPQIYQPTVHATRGDTHYLMLQPQYNTPLSICKGPDRSARLFVGQQGRMEEVAGVEMDLTRSSLTIKWPSGFWDVDNGWFREGRDSFQLGRQEVTSNTLALLGPEAAESRDSLETDTAVTQPPPARSAMAAPKGPTAPSAPSPESIGELVEKNVPFKLKLRLLEIINGSQKPDDGDWAELIRIAQSQTPPRGTDWPCLHLARQIVQEFT